MLVMWLRTVFSLSVERGAAIWALSQALRDQLDELALARRQRRERRAPPPRARAGRRALASSQRCHAGSCSSSRWLRLSSGTKRAPGMSAREQPPLVERHARVAGVMQHQRRAGHRGRERGDVDVVEHRA